MSQRTGRQPLASMPTSQQQNIKTSKRHSQSQPIMSQRTGQQPLASMPTSQQQNIKEAQPIMSQRTGRQPLACMPTSQQQNIKEAGSAAVENMDEPGEEVKCTDKR